MSEKTKCCWACWDEDDNAGNPLIRACMGCKSDELKYIHEKCIETFITNLLISRAETLGVASIPGIPYLNGKATDSLIKSGVLSLDIMNDGKKEKGADECEPLMRGYQNMELASPLEKQALDLRCSRCLDAYSIKLYQLSSFRVLLSDQTMSILAALMTISVGILIIACSYVLYQGYAFAEKYGEERAAKELLIKTWAFGYDVDARTWASFMMFCFISAFLITSYAVYSHESGYSKVKVFSRDHDETQ